MHAIVNAVYVAIVPPVNAANSGPHFTDKIPLTRAISNAVGNTLNTMLFNRKLMPRVPRSIVRFNAPVCRSR